MKTFVGIALVWGLFHWNTAAYAFQFTSPANGTRVSAGSTIRLEVDPGKTEKLMGVLFTASLGVLRERLDAFPPWTWTLQIPPHYVGIVTFSATGRVLGQKTGWAPHAEVRIHVILPTQPTTIPYRVMPPFFWESPDQALPAF
jgi:hypothetical protein